MNKALKNILFSFFILSSFFFFITKVNANSIEKIEMDIYIDQNGNASITEIWNTTLNQGTEGYRPYTDMGNSFISNFTVSDETGTQYESLSSWNTSANFDQKAYKNGFHYISNGVELCWGISEYGNKTYTLKYTISNFVTQYTDTQGIYFNFLNLDQSVNNAKITIRSDKNFSLDNARIWGFGNNGTTTFEDGKIILNSNGYLLPSQYMVALIRFESNLFNTNNTSNQSFDDVYDSAMSNVNVDESNYDDDLYIFLVPLVFIFLPFALINITYFIVKKKLGFNPNSIIKNIAEPYDFGPTGKNLPKEDEINYYREIPCNKDLERAYWVAYNYNVVSTDTLREGVIGAILLKWIKDGLITVSKTKKGLFSFKDNNYAIDLSNMRFIVNDSENKLFEILKSAAGKNNILEAKEFKKWCKNNYERINGWFFNLNYMEEKKLEQQGLITSVQEETTSMFGSKRMVTTKKVNPQLREEAIQLKGLKKFLLDFSKMPKREYFEVHIWEEYLIYAQLLGIADKVEEQFSKLYPNFNEQTKLNTEMTTIAIRNMAYLGYKGYETGKHRDEMRSSSSSSRDYSGRSRNSGGGGRSYSSGGSSSRGSSGGGFR